MRNYTPIEGVFIMSMQQLTMKNKKFLFTASLAFIIAGIFSSCTMVDPDIDDMMNPDDMDPADTASNLEAAPDFNLTSISGAEVKLADFADKPLVIFFHER